MHELSVTQNLLEITLRQANLAGAKRITDIYLIIGQLSSIVDESVQFYWDIIARNTIAEDATLHFKRVPTQMICLDCQKEYSPTDNDFSCPNCHGTKVRVISGDEFLIEAIDVET